MSPTPSSSNTDPIRRVGALLSVGIRGAAAGDPRLEADLDICVPVGVGSVVLFDVDVPRYRALLDDGMPPDDARREADRNVTSPRQVRALCTYLRARLGDDLVILVDQEGGHVSRFRSEHGFRATLPSAAAFARLAPEERRVAARRQARELVSVGIDGNLAPVVDVGLRAAGPLVLKERTFGSEPATVIACARDVVAAQRAEGLASCVKHFPGLGAADLDTHHARPVLDEAARPTELEPYRALLSDRPPPEMVMVAHAIWPAVDPEHPASASSPVLRGVLREQLGFGGVIATDSLDMAGAGAAGSVPAAVEALLAGADLLMDAVNLRGDGEGPVHPARAMAEAVVQAVESGHLDGGWPEIERRSARVRALRRR